MKTAELAERLFESTLGALDVYSVHLGDQLGWYVALRDHPGSTPGELATLTGSDARYSREWLEQQTVAGLLAVEDASAGPEERRYSLPEEHVPVLADTDSTDYLTPLARMVAAAGQRAPDLVRAYQGGGGVSWEAFGPLMRTAQADMNRPWYLQDLGRDWFPAVPDLDERLRAGARVADVGCGEGWSAIGIAQAYPEVTVDGYDVDPPSIDAAGRHAEQHGLGDRVRFRHVEASTLDGGPAYDVVTAFECIHDMPDPVSVLRTMHGLVRPDGHVVVMDEAVPDEFTGPGDPVEQLLYGISLLVCLPDGMSHQPSVGTGTVMRRGTLEGYAREAGFSGLEVLPAGNDLWRFYRLLL